jgi:hypothetical protein
MKPDEDKYARMIDPEAFELAVPTHFDLWCRDKARAKAKEIVADVREECEERVANAIYDVMPYDGAKGWKPGWIPSGNSHKQDEARRLAKIALTPADSLKTALRNQGD